MLSHVRYQPEQADPGPPKCDATRLRPTPITNKASMAMRMTLATCAKQSLATPCKSTACFDVGRNARPNTRPNSEVFRPPQGAPPNFGKRPQGTCHRGCVAWQPWEPYALKTWLEHRVASKPRNNTTNLPERACTKPGYALRISVNTANDDATAALGTSLAAGRQDQRNA